MKLSQVPIKKLQLIYKSAKLLNNKLLKNYLQNIQRKVSWMKNHKNRKNGRNRSHLIASLGGSRNDDLLLICIPTIENKITEPWQPHFRTTQIYNMVKLYPMEEIYECIGIHKLERMFWCLQSRLSNLSRWEASENRRIGTYTLSVEWRAKVLGTRSRRSDWC